MKREELYIYFKGVFEEKNKSRIRHTKEIWNERAKQWKKQLDEPSSMTYVTGERVKHSIQILKKNGVLSPEIDMIDIGCGPGRFVAGFAPYVHHVTGTDISTEMVKNGEAYCSELGLGNTSFIELDFRNAQPETQGWIKAFDLCFSFMTPAVSNYENIQKMMRMSRKWCMSSFSLGIESRFDDEIVRGFGLDPATSSGFDPVYQISAENVKAKPGAPGTPWIDDKWMYSLFNLLWLEGYRPITDYYTISYEGEVRLTRERIAHQMTKVIRGIDFSEQDIARVEQHLRNTAGGEMFHEISKNRFGAVLWEV